MVTDGKATCKQYELLAAVNKIHLTNIKVISVGVGRNAVENELRLIASGSGSENVYSCKSFQELKAIAANISDSACKGSSSVVPPSLAPETTTTTTTPTTTSTPAPTPPPLVEQCVNKPMDIYMVVDISISIKPDQLIEEAKAVKSIMSQFDIGVDKTRVGIVKYHNFTIIEYNLSAFPTFADLNNADIVQRPAKVAGTRTDLGMERAKQNFDAESEAGKKKVIIVVTDGKATVPKPAFAKFLEDFHQNDITVFSVGVGAGAVEEQLQQIASDEEYVYSCADFDQLKQIAREISETVCTAVENDAQEEI